MNRDGKLGGAGVTCASWEHFNSGKLEENSASFGENNDFEPLKKTSIFIMLFNKKNLKNRK